MKKLILIILVLIISGSLIPSYCSAEARAVKIKDVLADSPASKEYRIVYFLTESAATPVATFLKEREMQARRLTHVIYFPTDIKIDKQANIAGLSDAENADWQALLASEKLNGYKVMYGFHVSMNIMRNYLADSSLQKHLIRQLVALQQMLKGAGMDFDIEYPASDNDTRLLGAFFKQLRAAMGGNILITADVGPESYMENSLGHLEGAVINAYLNWINLMTYGKGANNGMELMRKTVQEYVNKGVDSNKIVIGLPFYAKATWLDGNGKRVPFIPPYSYLVGKIADDDFVTDTLSFDKPGAQPAYLLFNSPRTIALKAKYAESFGGVMVWSWRYDVVDRHSLSDAILKSMNE